MATNGSFAQQEQYKSVAEQAGTVATEAVDASGATNDLSKDEVGWYFVEQYYTTLSKSPDRIHLFYNKRSQFVSGIEAEVANVSVGRQAIQDRIKQLDFHDTKVRVSNVDSQASSENIVIQVIGELSNKAAEPKKFVQTFVLAQQPTGYFVLNDIMRYIDEENDAETGAAAETAEEPSTEAPAAAEPANEESVEAVETVKEPSNVADASAAEQKVEEAQVIDEQPEVNGDEAAEPTEAEKPSTTVDKVDPEATAQELAEEDAKEPEKPQDPAPTPVAEKNSASLAEPVVAEPTGPPKPMTWASRAAAAAGPRPVVPLPKTATPPAQSQNRAPAPAAAAAAPTPAAAAPAAASQTPAAVAQPSAPAAAAAPTEAAPKDAAGWQTAGSDSKRQNRPQSISANPVEKDGTLGYVKYVTDKVQDAELRKALEAHGELAYFDINRQKNCAFVEYKTSEALLAALTANPHVVGGESIVVEQRRPKAAQFGGNFAGGRGGSQRGRGGFDGNRGGSQGNPRGGFSGQNRGRGGAARGRGNAQATTA